MDFKYSILNEDLIKKNKIRGRKQKCAVNIVDISFLQAPCFCSNTNKVMGCWPMSILNSNLHSSTQILLGL